MDLAHFASTVGGRLAEASAGLAPHQSPSAVVLWVVPYELFCAQCILRTSGEGMSNASMKTN